MKDFSKFCLEIFVWTFLHPEVPKLCEIELDCFRVTYEVNYVGNSLECKMNYGTWIMDPLHGSWSF